MKIAINSLSKDSGHSVRGIGVYTRNLVSHLKKIKDVQVGEVADVIEGKEAEIIHIPYFDLFFNTLEIHPTIPTIVTIHDVTPLVFANYYPPGIKGRINLFFQKQKLKKAAGVITDSENSKRDIARYLGYPMEKIHVVYLAQSDTFKVIKDKKILADVKQRYKLADEFALFVGNVNWNKNINNIAAACIDNGMYLYLIGKSFEQKDNLNHPELRSYVQFLKDYTGNPLIHPLGYVEDADLVAIYNLATVAMFPSFYEGFGLPVLEAQACGTPVITSNNSSLQEVAGQSALLVDPYDSTSIAEGISKIRSDQTTRDRMIHKGYENIKRFSWDKTAEQTIEVYKKILKK